MRVLLALASVLAAQPNSDRQIWSELDIRGRVSPGMDLTWSLLNRESFRGAHAAAGTRATGLDLNIRLSRHFALTPSYYYAESRTQTGQWLPTHLPTLAANLIFEAQRCVFSDRNRLVGVLSAGQAFWVYQNRPRLDCRIGSGRTASSVFVWDEVSYYSIAAWTRNRLASGVHVPLSARYTLDVFYMWQRDVRNQPGRVDALGVTLMGSFP